MDALEVQKEPAMEKLNKKEKKSKRKAPNSVQQVTKTRDKQPDLWVGMDLGDRSSHYAVLDEEGNCLYERTTPTTKRGMNQVFGALSRCRIAIEVGSHSPWISRQLTKLGHDVFVANPRQLKLIAQSTRKDDRMDAYTLARLVRADPELLRPIQHRGENAQEHMAIIRTRAALMETRTKLINTARGITKSFGERLASCDADYATPNRMAEELAALPEVARESITKLLEMAAITTAQIRALDEKVKQVARQKYPETARLTQVSGVGELTALTFVLTIDDAARFARSRDAGCYVGLRPKRRDSGQRQPQLGISKEGDRYLRKLLVQSAHCILGRKSPDSDLKRWGLKLAGQGGKNAKKRAVVAVARKLAVLLHRLWVSGEKYEPLRNANRQQMKSAA